MADVTLTHPASEHMITVSASAVARYKSQGWTERPPVDGETQVVVDAAHEFSNESSSSESSSSSS